MGEVAVKVNIFRRAFNRLTEYAKNIAYDYADVAKNVVKDSRSHPLKAGISLSLIGFIGYAFKTNPSESDFKDRLCMLRQQMVLLPEPIHSLKSGLYVKMIYLLF
jgi:hypothetical protein